MTQKIAINVIDFTTTYLPNWQQTLEKSPYDSLKNLCEDIYGPETWRAIVFFGGVDPLAYLYKERGQTAEFTNYILEFFAEDYPHAQAQ